MAKIDDKAFDTMTAVADKTNVDIKKEGLYSGYAEKARGLRGGQVRPNFDESGKKIGESSVLMRAEIDPSGETKDWFAFPTLFHDKESGWNELSKDDEMESAFKMASNLGETFNFGQDSKAAIGFSEGSWKLPDILKNQ